MLNKCFKIHTANTKESDKTDYDLDEDISLNLLQKNGGTKSQMKMLIIESQIRTYIQHMYVHIYSRN